MEDTMLQQAATALGSEWGLQLPPQLTEEEVINLLTQRVLQIAGKGQDAFFQMMYRLDIPERKVHAALHDADAARQIAVLIFRRQVQKYESRLANRRPPSDDDDDLRW